jgi:hypothetical protein
VLPDLKVKPVQLARKAKLDRLAHKVIRVQLVSLALRVSKVRQALLVQPD